MKILKSTTPPPHLFYACAENLTIALDEIGALCATSFSSEKQSLLEWKKRWPQTSFQKTTIAKIPTTFRLIGTPFQQSVWQSLLKIPYGETRSYAAIARQINNPKATRAVGTACGKNPIPFYVPCHRVIASDGTLGGFSAPMAIKKSLLKSELPSTAAHKSTAKSTVRSSADK